MIDRPVSSMLRPAPAPIAVPPVAVSISTSQPTPSRPPGRVNVTGSRFALNSSRKLWSHDPSPRGPGSVIASPFRNTPSDLA